MRVFGQLIRAAGERAGFFICWFKGFNSMAKDRSRISAALYQVRDDGGGASELSCFARAMRLDESRFRVIDAVARAPVPAMLDGMDAVLFGGSRFSVFEDMPHLAELVAAVREAKDRRLPMFGVCFGAQLMAHAFDGEVVRDEAKQEYGTFDIRCSDDAMFDLLFADMPDAFAAQCAHHDRIAKLPANATLLATSERCGVQAFVMPGDAYGVQFHPERSREDFDRLLAAGGDYAEGVPAESIRPRLRESPHAEALLARFIDRIVLQR